jgi:RNA polymerase sigma-70 factor (ECF subfamily)
MSDNVPNLRAAYDAGRKAWPDIALDPDLLTAFLLQHREVAALNSPAIAADIYLACACQHNVPGALQAFLTAYGIVIQTAARAIDPTTTFADEVRQRLAENLFVAPVSQVPRISQYAGKGPLGSWVRSAARRIALRLHHQQRLRNNIGAAALAEKLSPAHGPDLLYIDARHRQEFQDALGQAIADLPKRDRLLLRLHLLEGLSLSRIAKMQSVTQPTVSRWLQKARDEIVSTMRFALRDQLGVNDSDFESIIGLIGSKLDFSLSAAIGRDSTSL